MSASYLNGCLVQNWPWCYPLTYHNIYEEIPAWNRGMVRTGYTLWLISALGFFLNWIIVVIMAFAKTGGGVKGFFLASLATAIGLPLSWLLWYRNLYNAAQTDGATFR